jgi:pseudouridine synthase, RluA family
MKFNKKDVIGILWRFNQLGGAEIIDDTFVTKISTTNPNPKNTLLSFSYKDSNYFALFDELNDDTDKIENEIKRVFPNTLVEVLKSPSSDHLSHAFKGKEMYLSVQLNTRKRLDIWLSENYQNINRSMWKKYIGLGFVVVNGSSDVKSSQLVNGDDEIVVNIPDDVKSDSKLDIIYKDSDVVVVNKPAGVLSHSKGSINDEFTVADFFEEFNCDQSLSNRTGVVHRLDRDTSGVMIGARTEEARVKLQKQFSERKAKKTYYAVVEGSLKADKAIINLPIARNMKHPTTFLVSPNGREAETVYEVLDSNGKYSILKLSPKTGRTHQLRVHLAYIGHPIVGDRIYGKEADRLYLHASELEITLPSSKRETFKSELPAEFKTKVA